MKTISAFPQGSAATSWRKRAFLQASRLGAEFLTQQGHLHPVGEPVPHCAMNDGREVTCHVCLISTGVAYCKLDVPGAERLAAARAFTTARR